MKPAISYCRVSTRKQSEEGASLQTQAVSIKEYATEVGVTIGREFSEVYSGGELYDRPCLNEARGLIKSGQYGMLICHSIDRLSRDAVHLMILAEECDRAGVELRFVTEALDDTPEGKLIQYVKGYAAQVEREKRREQAVRGRRNVVLSGKIHNAGSEKYGYRRDKSKGVREIHEPEATVIRRIFEMTITGRGARTIAATLDAEGIPSPSAGKRALTVRSHHWGCSEIKRILHDEAYKGETIAWQWRSKSKGKRGVFKRDASDHIKLPADVTPAIVNKNVWQAAQEAMTERRGDFTRNQKREYLLRGYLFCGDCGQRMYTDPNKGTRAYRCSSRGKVGGKCAGLMVNASAVEQWAWDELSAFINNPRTLLRFSEKQRKGERRSSLAGESERLNRQLARIASQQQRLVKRLRLSDDDAIASLIEKELIEVEKEKATITARLGEIEKRAVTTTPPPSIAEVSKYCAPFALWLRTATFDQKRLTLQAFRVTVHAEGRPNENWKMDVFPNGGGESDTTSECYSQNPITIYYKQKKKVA